MAKRRYLQYLDDTDDYQNWLLQEYIESPIQGENFSLRVVVDMFGNIQREFIMQKQEVMRRTDIDKSQGRTYLSAVFEDPRSIYFLNSRSIISNGGSDTVYPLDRGVKLPEYYSRLLGNNNTLPTSLIGLSSGIGQIVRPYFPYCGIDFVWNKQGKAYYLETNSPPSLIPGELYGFEKGLSEDELKFAMIERILKEVILY